MASTRRTFIRAAVGGGALSLLGAPPDVLAAARTLRLARDARFDQGVASGEPAPRAITLWTRLEGLTKPALTRLEVARDPHFKHVVHHERLAVSGAHDWTARARVAGLKPAEDTTTASPRRTPTRPSGASARRTRPARTPRCG